jgi:hypothetical protein
MQLENVTVIKLSDFEDEKLLSVKPTRTKGEYCWTCTSSTILYVLNNYYVESCTYIDADLYFYSSPKVLFDEIGDKSVLITEHRYTPRYDQSVKSGKYCVQFVYFRNNEKGREVLNYWRNACINWCYARHEDGKFGDQKYLDDWMVRFDCVAELQHIGGGVAPWNIEQYHLKKLNNELKINDVNLVFYHFHEFKFINKNNYVCLGGYKLSKDIINNIYFPYINQLLNIKTKLALLNEALITQECPKVGLLKSFKIFLNAKINRHNIFKING